jgi:hypothetical protein
MKGNETVPYGESKFHSNTFAIQPCTKDSAIAASAEEFHVGRDVGLADDFAPRCVKVVQ